MIPHHGGKARKCVIYIVHEAKAIEGIVSVRKDGKKMYGHSNGVVQSMIESIIANSLVMTKDSGDIDVWL